MKFEFATSNRILFGNGSLKKVAEIAPEFGHCCLIVTGSGAVPLEPLISVLDQSGVQYDLYRVQDEPDIPTIEEGISKAFSFGCDFVIGYGGGSSIDAAKAIAAMMTNPGNLLDYLEVVGKGKQISCPAAPMIALPTTAGTGTEVTRNAVIISPRDRVKVSMRSPMMIPHVAVVDPELTYSMPPSVTASTGMDALTQLIEAFVSNNANPITDGIAREGIKRGAQALVKAYQDGHHQKAREDMALASLLGGIVLANAGLGAVHGFAGVIGGMFDAPHGEICASLLPYVMKYNAQTLSTLEDGKLIEQRYQEVAGLLTGQPDAQIEEGVEWTADLQRQLKIPTLRSFGIEKRDFDSIIEKSMISSSMQKNPVRLGKQTLRQILEEAY